MGRRKTYTRLVGMLHAKGYDQRAVAEQLGISISGVSRRYTGHTPWHIDEMYCLMDMIQAPYKQLHKIFPKGGVEK